MFLWLYSKYHKDGVDNYDECQKTLSIFALQNVSSKDKLYVSFDKRLLIAKYIFQISKLQVARSKTT